LRWQNQLEPVLMSGETAFVRESVYLPSPPLRPVSRSSSHHTVINLRPSLPDGTPSLHILHPPLSPDTRSSTEHGSSMSTYNFSPISSPLLRPQTLPPSNLRSIDHRLSQNNTPEIRSHLTLSSGFSYPTGFRQPVPLSHAGPSQTYVDPGNLTNVRLSLPDRSVPPTSHQRSLSCSPPSLSELSTSNRSERKAAANPKTRRIESISTDNDRLVIADEIKSQSPSIDISTNPQQDNANRLILLRTQFPRSSEQAQVDFAIANNIERQSYDSDDLHLAPGSEVYNCSFHEDSDIQPFAECSARRQASKNTYRCYHDLIYFDQEYLYFVTRN